MPTIKELKDMLEIERGNSRAKDDYIQKLEERNDSLAHDRTLAERQYETEKAKNIVLMLEIDEWKKIATHLTEQVVKKGASLLALEEHVGKTGNAKNDGDPMPF